MYPEALESMRVYGNLAGEPEFIRKLQKAYSAFGYAALTREELKKDLQDRANGKYRNPTGIASFYASLGDETHAFEWLQKAYEEHSSGMQYLAVDPQFDAIHSNPRYKYWLGVLGLPTSIKFERPAPATAISNER
jgi:hypothetical protein